MLKLPIRKCFYVIKICALLLLVLSILTLFEHWRGGKRSARAQFADPVLEEYERQILEDEARIIPGLGDNGAAAYLTGEDKRLGDESEKKYAINTYLSDRISYNRTLADFRNTACNRVTYDAELPSASVIIIFHNEPYSVVIRTLWSVLNSARRSQPWYRRANKLNRHTHQTMELGYPGQDPDSEFVYLKEIILVDDNSTLPELKGKLSHYLRTRLPPGMVRLVRLPDRIGLIRARHEGAGFATGDVLVFLDAHCEANPDWLRPLLQRIKDSPHSVLTPIIDMVEGKNFVYDPGEIIDFEGLMRARSRGARTARGDVLVFLDAHCEPSSDWLRPLLQRIRHKRDAIVTPIIDVLDQSTFRLIAAENFQVGGFTFAGHFTWIDVPEREKKRRGSDIAPTWSPTMAGGLFAMSRDYYWELGAYDEQMAGWGGENLEMSFRIWQCGGTLETIPCSRVGHVFRSFHPYGLPADSDTHGINTARMAEVWMDEYAELFYLHRPDLRKNPIIGDVTHRKILREKLQCKSFQWYLDNIYQEKFVPVRDVSAYGRVKNPQSGLCLDTMQREEEASPLGVYPCHPLLSGTQYLSLSLTGQLRDEEKCAELQFVSFSMAYFLDALSSMKLQAAFNHTLTAILNTIRAAASDSTEDVSRRVLMVTCTGRQKGQQWRYLPSGQLQHVESGLCLDARGLPAGADARARPCAPPSPPSPRPSPRPAPPAQRWRFDCSDQEPAHSDLFSADQEERLRKLKRQRRKSRSLLSIESEMSPIPPDSPSPNNPPEDPIDPADGSQDTRRHRPANKHKRRKGKSKKKGKKKGHKNKFILAVERTLMNSSEEHLELDVHCAHRRLLPNDTFVRDIVTILNEHNIRVINNGRVFERNRVTEIGKLDPRTMRHKDKKILHKMEVPADGAPDERPPGTPAPLPDTPVPVTPATTTQLTTQEPAEVIQEKIIKKKRTRSKGGREHSPPPPAEPPATTAASRIIVEDFVPVRPAATTSPKQRSRKHKRKRQRSTAAPEQRAEEPEESPVLLTKRGGSGLRPSHTVHDASDVHDGPDAHDVHDGSDSDDNYWAVGIGSPKARNRPYPVVRARAGAAARGTEDAAEGGGLAFSSEEAGAGAKRSYARNNSAHQRSILERLQHHTAPPDQRESETEDAKETHDKMAARGRGRAAAAGGREDIDTEAESTPVKLVMKSNLTFNLGDELFAWRRRPDLANLLEQQLSPGRLADASSASDSSAGT